MADEKKIVVDKEKCIGCGTCIGIAEDYFEYGKDGKSQVKKQCDEKDEDIIDEAIKSCPADAISLR